MATIGKDGKRVWDEEEENMIAMQTEARVRAVKQLRSEEKPPEWDGKTERRGKGNERRKAARGNKKKPFW